MSSGVTGEQMPLVPTAVRTSSSDGVLLTALMGDMWWWKERRQADKKRARPEDEIHAEWLLEWLYV